MGSSRATEATILIVDDDGEQVRSLRADLRAAFPGFECEFCTTEREFAALVDGWRHGVTPVPAAVVLDMMIRYANPSRAFVPEDMPELVHSEGPMTAGNRCLDLLRGNSRTSAVPVAMFTVIPEKARPDPLTVVVAKELDNKPLVAALRSLLVASGWDLRKPSGSRIAQHVNTGEQVLGRIAAVLVAIGVVAGAVVAVAHWLG